MLRFAVSRTVRAPNAAVWRVLGDFGTEHRWTTSVSECRRNTESVRVGTVRTCTLPKPLMGHTQAVEYLTEYAPGVALAYALEGPAGPFSSASSLWSTNPLADNATTVTVEGHFAPRNRWVRFVVWPLATLMLRRLTCRVIGELETFVVAQSPATP